MMKKDPEEYKVELKVVIAGEYYSDKDIKLMVSTFNQVHDPMMSIEIVKVKRVK